MTTVKKTIGKYFRLIDFQTFDHTEAESSDNDSTDKSKSTKSG